MAQRQELLEPALQPPLVVLQRQVEDVTLINLDRAKSIAAACDRDGSAEDEPALADLRLACEQRQALGDEAGHDIADGRQVLGHEIGRACAAEAAFTR